MPTTIPLRLYVAKAQNALNSNSLGGIAASSYALKSDVSSIPPGSIVYFSGSSTPSGYFVCNGAAVSRTTYSALFAKIGTTYGAGDGSSTFNIPNLAGKFIRATGGNAAALGVTQGDAIRNLTGAAGTDYGYGGYSGAFFTDYYFGNMAADGSAYPFYRVRFDASRQVPTANENRPVNMSMVPLIKY